MSVLLIFQVEMDAGRGACCSLVSRSEYADGTDGRTDGRPTVTLRFPLNAASVVLGIGFGLNLDIDLNNGLV